MAAVACARGAAAEKGA